MPFGFKDRYMELAGQLDGKTSEEALEANVSDPGRVAQYVQTPWKLEIDKVMWDHRHPEGVARAIREVIEDWPVSDRELLRRVTAPTLPSASRATRSTRRSWAASWTTSFRARSC